MGALFPGAKDLQAFAANLRSGVDAIREVPETRWDKVYFDPSSDRIDRIYCSRGGFVDENAEFDALAFGVVPAAVEGAEPDQLLSLAVAHAALRDAGLDPLSVDARLPRERTAVILGRGGYLTAGTARLEQRVRVSEQVVTSLRTLVPSASAADLERVRAELQDLVGPIGPDALVGLVPNLAASRIANRLDLHGVAYTVDAACASSLVAVDHGVRELGSGRADLVVAGGVHLCQEATFWAGFCRLGAVSRAQTIRPFDRRADGLLLGEGVGMLVLKRLADAERDGDRIYAVIRGTGVASDGRAGSLLAPSVEGQVAAVEAAWRRAGIEPSQVGLLEAHGTATPTGDAAELETLMRVFGGPPVSGARPVLGSVKSMIGHAMPAAGAAGLIKAVLALHEGLLLPTLHCDEPHAKLQNTRFRVIDRAEPWDGARVAGVSAFGFGGINAHVVVEAHARSSPRGASAKVAPPRSAPFAFASADDLSALAAAIRSGNQGSAEGAMRAALVEPTAERRERLALLIERGQPWSGRHGMYFSPRGLLANGGKIAFLFPGIDASFEPRVDDVAAWLAEPLPKLDRGLALERTGLGVITVNRLMDRALRAMKVFPDMMAGHSIGEWSAMVASGIVAMDDVGPFIESLAPGTLDVPGVVFAAVAAGIERILPSIADLDAVALSHDNCPHQVILCGDEGQIDVAVERLAEAGILGQKLPFRSGFHSPLFAPYLAPHRTRVASLAVRAASVPLWSATTLEPYPADPAAIRALVIDHLVKPVRFRELLLGLHGQGARVFLQVGTGSLPGFVGDTLRGLPHLTVAANVRERAGMDQLLRVALALFVEGHRGVAPWLYGELGQAPPTPSPSPGARPSRPMRLRLGAPLLRLTRPLVPSATPSRPPPSSRMGKPLAAAFDAAFDEVASAKLAVLDALRAPRSSRPGRTSRPVSPPPTSTGPSRQVLRMGVETYPELRDHAFYPQPPGWPVLEDRYPVVPLTMIVALFLEAAEKACPGRVATTMLDLSAYRWMAVEPPIDVTLTTRVVGQDRVIVEAEGYASATVLLAAGYPDPKPFAPEALVHARAPVVVAEALYRDGWMFHGPAYQGVVELGSVGQNGMDGKLRALSSRGGLLDNAGQLFGYWVMEQTEVDRLAMPIRVGKIELFGPEPRPPASVDCHVRSRHLGPEEVRADITLLVAGRVWAQIQDWEDRRFDTDARSFALLRAPSRHALSTVSPEGTALLVLPFRDVPQVERLARRYLGVEERREHAAVPPKQRYAWLLGRVAMKDALRAALAKEGEGDLFPIEVSVSDDERHLPIVTGRFAGRMAVAVSTVEDAALAFAAPYGEVGVGLARAGEDPAAALREASRMARERSGGGEVTAYVEGGYAMAWAVRPPDSRSSGSVR